MSKLTALLLLAPALALAQTTQPVYIRPSKGTPISLTLVANTPSVIFDFSAFNAAQVTVTGGGGGTPVYSVDNLNQFVRFQLSVSPGVKDKIETLTSPLKDPASFGIVRAQNGSYSLLSSGIASATAVITPLPLSPNTGVTGLVEAAQQIDRAAPVYPVLVGGVALVDGNNKSAEVAAAQNVVYPFINTASPLDVLSANLKGLFVAMQDVSVGNRNASSPAVISVAALAGNTTVFSPASYLSGKTWSRNVSVQNVGTTGVLCRVGSTAVTTSSYSVALAAGTANDDGKGGSYIFKGLLPESTVICGANGGAGRVALEHW